MSSTINMKILKRKQSQLPKYNPFANVGQRTVDCGSWIRFSVATGSFKGHLRKCLNKYVSRVIFHLYLYFYISIPFLNRKPEVCSNQPLNFTNQGTPSYLTELSQVNFILLNT